MGGTITIAIRRDGATTSMNRWTNIMPTALHDPAFLDMAVPAVEGFLSNWREMAEDWRANGPDGPFVHEMTDVYAPYPAPLAPNGYGLVVVDDARKEILSLQSYCGIGYVNWLEGTGGEMANSIDGGEKAALVRDLFRANRIASYTARAREPHHPDVAPFLALPGARLEPLPHPKMAARYPKERMYHLPGTVAPDDVVAAGARMRAGTRFDQPLDFFRVQVDMRPFTLHVFDETAAGAAALRAHMLSTGFVFTQEEDALWDAWIAEHG